MNTVAGNAGVRADGSLEQDSFGFTVPAGHQLASVAITATNSIGNITVSPWQFRTGDTQFFTSDFAEALVAYPGQTVQSVGVYPAGSYQMNSFSFTVSGPAPHRVDYSIALTVAAVPEPTTLAALAGVALVGLRRRRA